MRLLILFLLCVFMMIPLAFATDVSSIQKKSINVIELEKPTTENNWVYTISSDTAAISDQLKLVTKDTPKEEVNKIIKDALEKVQKMRDYAKQEGVIVEGFSLNIGLTPSITIDFKFKDK